MTALDLVAGIGLVAWLYLLLFNGGFWLSSEREESEQNKYAAPKIWPRVTAVIPARNEADMLPLSLTSLVEQNYPGEFSILLVDDQSTDGTADVARAIVRSLQTNRTETVLGYEARWILRLNRFFPGLLNRLLVRKVGQLYAHS